MLDPDEKVRAAACRIYSQMDYETALHYVTLEQLRDLAERTRDKRVCLLDNLSTLTQLDSAVGST